MNVRDLKELLNEMDDDAEVRFASQPSWPFEYSVAGAEIVQPYLDCPPTEYDEDGNELPYWEQPDYVDPDDQPEVIYLVEGSQIGYLPQQVADMIGW